MTRQEFSEIVSDLELIVIESFLLCKALRVDPAFVKQAFGTDLKMVKYALPLSGVVPVETGSSGEFKIIPTKNTDDIP